MFDMEKKMKFVRSLAGSKADQFQSIVREGIAGGSETLQTATDNAQEALAESAGRMPAMVLAETYEDIGTQLEGGEIEDISESITGRQNISEAIPSQPTSLHPGASSPATFGIPSTERAKISRSEASEIMKKKLNHIQIEKLAETLKQRLDAELKIQKERWGEEP